MRRRLPPRILSKVRRALWLVHTLWLVVHGLLVLRWLFMGSLVVHRPMLEGRTWGCTQPATSTRYHRARASVVHEFDDLVLRLLPVPSVGDGGGVKGKVVRVGQHAHGAVAVVAGVEVALWRLACAGIARLLRRNVCLRQGSELLRLEKILHPLLLHRARSQHQTHARISSKGCAPQR